MSREKQIEEMTNDLCDIDCKGMKCDSCDSYGCEYRMQAEALYNAGYRKQSEWISVDERLPEENGRHLACVEISHLAFEGLTTVVMMEYSKTNGFNVSGEETVTHWMPLPEAPKMKGGAE